MVLLWMCPGPSLPAYIASGPLRTLKMDTSALGATPPAADIIKHVWLELVLIQNNPPIPKEDIGYYTFYSKQHARDPHMPYIFKVGGLINHKCKV